MFEMFRTAPTTLYCAAHEPDLRPGRNRDLKILRHRLAPGNSCSRSFAAPLDSTDHEMFRTEMCDVRLLGTDGACRYYLSRITGVDHFALWSDVYLENLREFADQQSDGAANAFRIDQDTVGVIVPLLKVIILQKASRFNPQNHERGPCGRTPVAQPAMVGCQDSKECTYNDQPIGAIYDLSATAEKPNS